MKTIPLYSTKYLDLVTIVDDEDYDFVSQFAWTPAHNHRHIKAQRYYRGENGKPHTEYMHTMLMRPPEGMTVDHINCNGLDNRRCNLRLATIAENARNQRKRLGEHASQYKGVSIHRGHSRGSTPVWVARIIFNRRNIYLGRFPTEDAAALAYNEASIKYHGEFGRQNPFQS